MDKNICYKYLCNNPRFKRRLCKFHYERFKASRRRFVTNIPKVYYDRIGSTPNTLAWKK